MAKLIKNEQIKARDIILYDLNNQYMGEMLTSEALKLAQQQDADLVVTQGMQSPPQCQLVARGKANQVLQQLKPKDSPAKTKEIRLTPHIEQHDLDTKIEQIKKLLSTNHLVLLVIKIQGKESKKGEALAQEILQLLASEAKPQTKLQISGKQIQVTLEKK